jgi:hypothetical protein
VNKFFTLGVGVILVLVGKGIVWGQMTTEANVQPPGITVATATSSGLPKPLDLSRFDALAKKSPFTLASATAEADFAKDLVLGGYVRMDGEDFVIVANKTKPERILVGRKPSPPAQGMVLLELKKDPSGDPSKLQAKIKKGTEMATLKYEITGGGGAPVAPIPVTTQGQPPIPGLPGQQPGQGQVNSGGKPNASPVPSIRRRSMIPVPQGGKK